MWVGALAFLVLLGVGGRSEGGQGVRRAESVAVVVVVPRWHAGAGGFATTLLSSALVDVSETSVTALPKLGPRLRSRVRNEGALRR